MSYDPTPLPSSTDAELLAVHVAGGDGEPDCVYELARPRDGRVAVRALPAPGAPHGFEAACDVVLDRLEGARRAGGRVSVEGYALRHWLLGRA
ncbi:hypothetical protein [Roseisolibacter agri]|uniref:Uncharacterized protein n=1 Tax=Roseisolibacter agri TaxID=2014610 RepID=A0AA37QER3_9BACT|nr:hypothetical protein [Roseisolibacter agri]GLC24398.1 hypothetical protein rosag_09110 [Roseisolibacter agri]